jgi:hypothetical protein
MIPILLSLVLQQGQQGPPLPTGPTRVDPNEIPFVSLESGADSPLKKLGIMVFQNADQFQGYLTQIHETKLKKPTVDWSTQELIAIQAKGLSQDGSSIKIKRIYRTSPGHVRIEVIVLKNLLPENTNFSINLSSKTQYPFAIIQTQKIPDKLDVSVVNG